MFYLKKTVAFFFMPLPLVIAVIAYGLWLIFFRPGNKKGFLFVLTGLVFLLASSTSVLPRLFLLPLERQYPSFSLERTPERDAIAAIVVLGGGHVVDRSLPALSRLNPSSLERVTEALRIHRLLPGRKLVFSGGAVMARGPVGLTMAAAARELGLTDADILVEQTSMDTDDQARVISRLMAGAPFVLVTSASHMPRAMRLFRAEGARPIAAPCGHMLKTGGGMFAASEALPDGGRIVASERVFYEFLGLGWCWLKETGRHASKTMYGTIAQGKS